MPNNEPPSQLTLGFGLADGSARDRRIQLARAIRDLRLRRWESDAVLLGLLVYDQTGDGLGPAWDAQDSVVLGHALGPSCARSKFYEIIRALKRDGLLQIEKVDGGAAGDVRRSYRVDWASVYAVRGLPLPERLRGTHDAPVRNADCPTQEIRNTDFRQQEIRNADFPGQEIRNTDFPTPTDGPDGESAAVEQEEPLTREEWLARRQELRDAIDQGNPNGIEHGGARLLNRQREMPSPIKDQTSKSNCATKEASAVLDPPAPSATTATARYLRLVTRFVEELPGLPMDSRWIARRLAELVVCEDMPIKVAEQVAVSYQRRRADRSLEPISDAGAYLQACARDAVTRAGFPWMRPRAREPP